MAVWSITMSWYEAIKFIYGYCRLEERCSSNGEFKTHSLFDSFYHPDDRADRMMNTYEDLFDCIGYEVRRYVKRIDE